MHRFIVLYRAPLTVAQRFANATPEEAQRGLQSWVDWAEKLGPALLDPGKPLGNAVNVNAGGINPSDSDVIGMSILQAESRTDALEMVKDHHHLRWADSCEITVLEEMPIPEVERADSPRAAPTSAGPVREPVRADRDARRDPPDRLESAPLASASQQRGSVGAGSRRLHNVA